MGVLAGSCPWHKARGIEAGEQMLRTGVAGHCRTCLGYGIQAGLQRDGVREREDEYEASNIEGRSKNRSGEYYIQFLFSLLLLWQQLNL